MSRKTSMVYSTYENGDKHGSGLVRIRTSMVTNFKKKHGSEFVSMRAVKG